MTKSKITNGHTDGEASHSAYSLPTTAAEQNDNIVDMVCRIVHDDGLRPTQGNRNAAEQFDFEHQEPYEARGKQSRNIMEQVHMHNSAYPKMRDELDRKRSLAKVTMSTSQRNVSQHTYNHCNACIKNKKQSTPKKKSHTSRYPRDSKKKAGPRQSSITKPKSRLKSKRSPCRCCKLSRIQIMNRGCQCSSSFLASRKMSGTNEIPLNMDCENQNQLAEESTFLFRRDVKNISERKRPSIGSKHSKDGSPKSIPEPEPDNGSITTYESYASLDSLGHEPMV